MPPPVPFLGLALAAAGGLAATVALAVAWPAGREPAPSPGRPWGPAARRGARVAGLAAGAAGLAAGLTAALLGIPVLVALAALGGALAVPVVDRARAQRARQRLHRGLVEAVEVLVQLLPTGQSVRQGIEVLAERGPQGARVEFARLQRQLQDLQFEAAVREMEARVGDPLFTMMAAALIVGNRSGGQLVPVFQELGRAMRQTEAVRSQVRAEQAQGRYGALVICLMPLVVLAVLHTINPAYLAPYGTLRGASVLAGIVLTMAAGYLWMLRILRLPEWDRLPLRPPSPRPPRVAETPPARPAGARRPSFVPQPAGAAAAVSAAAPAATAAAGPAAPERPERTRPLPPPPPPPPREDPL